VKLLVFVGSLWFLWEFWFSEPSIAHGDLDVANPFSIPFEIQNPHYFPLRIDELRCIVDVTYETYSETNQQLLERAPETVRLWHTDRTAYTCPFANHAGYKEIAVRMIVRYWTPFIPLRLNSHADFRVIRDSQGQPHWTAGLDPTAAPHSFVEYPVPVDAQARWFCDIVGSLPDTADLCPLRMPWAGALKKMKVEKVSETKRLIRIDATRTKPQKGDTNQ